MARSSRAHYVPFGFDFQINAGIILMIENIDHFSSLRLEGHYEDIEIQLDNGKYILAQAKSVVKACADFSNVREKLKEGLRTLSKGSKDIDIEKLIYITNSPNPLKDESHNIFLGEQSHRMYNTLPEGSQKLIADYLKSMDLSLDLNKFMIQVFQFETDEPLERYKVVEKCVDYFISELRLSVPNLTRRVLSVWHKHVFINSSTSNPDIVLTKKDIIWPIIVIITETKDIPEDLDDRIDESLYEDIVHNYRDLINNCSENYALFIKVIHDYTEYKESSNFSKKIKSFIDNKWQEYVSEFNIDEIEDLDEDLKIGLTKTILYKILANRRDIDKVKRRLNIQ